MLIETDVERRADIHSTAGFPGLTNKTTQSSTSNKKPYIQHII